MRIGFLVIPLVTSFAFVQLKRIDSSVVFAISDILREPFATYFGNIDIINCGIKNGPSETLSMDFSTIAI